MKTVRVYYGGIPARNNKLEKRLVLENFHLGVSNDDLSTEVNEKVWQPSDLAVIQGWVHTDSPRTPHLEFRRKIIEEQRRIGKHTLAIDSNLFLYRDPDNIKTYLRFSLDDVFPTTGNYFTDTVDCNRWKTLKQNLGIEIQPWRTNGQHILICLQRNGGWSMGGLDVMQWCNKIIKTIRQYSDRPIVVRAHPGDKRTSQYLKLKFDNVIISPNKNILDDFKNCWAVITYNSSPGVAAAIEGIPVFVTDPEPQKSQAYDVANTDITEIENPKTFERQQWIEKIAMCHFSFEELQQGIAWNIIRPYI